MLYVVISTFVLRVEILLLLFLTVIMQTKKWPNKSGLWIKRLPSWRKLQDRLKYKNVLYKDTDMRKVFILFDVFTKLPPMSKQIVCNWILFSSDLMLVGNSLKTNSLYYYLYPKTTSEQENPLDQLLKLFLYSILYT